MKVSTDQILDATIGLAKEVGWGNTSVRGISKRINYSTIKIYSEFGSKENLLVEVQKRGFRLLKRKYINSISNVSEPKEQFINLCIAHYTFARTHQRYYELMFQVNGVACKRATHETLSNAGEPVRNLIEELSGRMNTALFLGWWSMIHGFTLIAQNNFDITEREAIKVLRGIVENYIKGIE